MPEDEDQGSSATPSTETRHDEREVDHAFGRLAAVLKEVAVDAVARETERLSGGDSPAVDVQENLD